MIPTILAILILLRSIMKTETIIKHIEHVGNRKNLKKIQKAVTAQKKLLEELHELGQVL